MSELKWNWVYYPYLDAPNKQEESALKAGYIKVVCKDEADKVIANRDYEIEELKKSIGRLLKAKTEQVIHEVMQKTLIYGEGFIRVEDAMKLIVELRHQKFKRCLAMADKCSEALCYWDNVKFTFFKGESYCFRKMNHYGKWGQIWLAISEKFKEGK